MYVHPMYESAIVDDYIDWLAQLLPHIIRKSQFRVSKISDYTLDPRRPIIMP